MNSLQQYDEVLRRFWIATSAVWAAAMFVLYLKDPASLPTWGEYLFGGGCRYSSQKMECLSAAINAHLQGEEPYAKTHIVNWLAATILPPVGVAITWRLLRWCSAGRRG